MRDEGLERWLTCAVKSVCYPYWSEINEVTELSIVSSGKMYLKTFYFKYLSVYRYIERG